MVENYSVAAVEHTTSGSKIENGLLGACAF